LTINYVLGFIFNEEMINEMMEAYLGIGVSIWDELWILRIVD
jgi:hypothetical protein